MKKIFNHIIVITFLLFITASCDDVLDQTSVNSFTQDLVFSDIKTANAFLDNCYDMMSSRRGNWLGNVLGAQEDLLSCSTDQLFNHMLAGDELFVKGSLLTSDLLGLYDDQGGEWGTRNGHIFWNGLYKNIQNTNTLIANIDQVFSKSSGDIERIKGEAYFIRAFMYTQLLRTRGGLVLSDTPFKLGQDLRSVKRSTIEETKDFILADIEKSIALLPETMEQGRATRAAAAALKSRLLTFCASTLTTGGYEANNLLVSFPAGSRTALLKAARDAAKAVMDGTYGTFSLVGTTENPPSTLSSEDIKKYSDNFFNIFAQKGKWNSETIWAIQHATNQNGIGNVSYQNTWYGPNGYHGQGLNNPTESAVRSFEMADGTPFDWDRYTSVKNGPRTATAAELVVEPNRNPYNGREPRFYASILYNGAKWIQRLPGDIMLEPNGIIQTCSFYNAAGTKTGSGIDSRGSSISPQDGTKTGYFLKKFMDTSAEIYKPNANHYVEFRYSEILLDYAEACIELDDGDLQKGIDALNMVRNRAGLPDRITTDQATARKYLRHEREIEFFAEDQRWYDIRRWMIVPEVIKNIYSMQIKQYDNGNMEWYYNTKGVVVDQRSFDPRSYWIPIMRTEINKSFALQQNPGY